METEGYKFDLVTQRFLVSRWNTELGKQVRSQVIDGLKNWIVIRSILDPYVLDHPDNIEPDGYPYYPPDAMQKNSFWLLTHDDLRGISFYNDDFSGSHSFEKKKLNYSSFYKCNLTGTDLEVTDLSFARFEKCKLDKAILSYSNGFSTHIVNCSARDACFWVCRFRDCDFSGTDFRGTYFEDMVLEDIKVNYRTRFDFELNRVWEERTMPLEQMPDIMRSIRVAYEKAELWSLMDRFLLREKTEQRKRLLWPQLRKEKTLSDVPCLVLESCLWHRIGLFDAAFTSVADRRGSGIAVFVVVCRPGHAERT